MSYPPGPPDPDAPRDPWATPTGAPGVPSDPPAQPYGDPAQGAPGNGQQYGQQYGQAPYGPPAGYGGPSYGRPANGKAQAALWSGIGLLLTSCCVLGVLGFVPIVLGVMARREIRERNGQQGGDGMAIAGIVMGALAIGISLLVIIVIVIAFASGNGSFETYGTTGV